ADLAAFGQGAASLLRQAMQTSEDIEVVRRCERCLEAIDKNARVGLPAVAARVIAARKPDGAADVLLAYLPFADDESIADEVRTALAAVAYRDGKADPVLTAALEDKDALRRAAAVGALIRAAKPEQRTPLTRFLQDADATVR